VQIDCPPYAVSGSQFECFVTIVQGTNIDAETSFGDGTSLYINTPGK